MNLWNKTKARYRYGAIMLREMVKADFKLRYQSSVLGYLWSLLKPMALFTVLYIVFVRILKIGGDVPNFGISLLLGIVVWTFFVEVTTQSLGSIVGKGDLIRKVMFPRYVIALAPVFSAMINLVFNLIIVAIFMFAAGISINTGSILVIPLIIELFLLTAAMAVILSATYVKFRDLTHIWDVVLQAAFYATPILYPLSLVPAKAAKILMVNPLAQIIQDMRYVLISDQTQTIGSVYGHGYYRLIPIGISVSVACLAVAYFKHRSKYLAEEV